MQTLRAKLTHPITLFFLLTILGYGLLLPYTGFYWDDWPFAWIAKFLGPAEFIPAFAPFRPFLGPIFYITTSLIPPLPLYWQIFALIVRFLMGIATWWTFKQIWPERPHLALTVSLLLLVFPGYSQHWVAYTHINQELIPFLFYTLSFGFTFKALREEHPRIYMVIAVLLQICGIFPTEYFFGMEGLRGLFLFFNVQGNFLARVRQTLKIWWPYLIVWLLNAAWLVYYYRFGPYNSYEVTGADETTHLGLLPEILDTLWKVCFYIWGQLLVLLSSNLLAPSSMVTLGLIVISFALLLFYSPLFQEKTGSREFAWSLITIGLIGILLGRLPSLAAGLPLRLQSSYDRFMVSMMIAGSIFLVGLIELIFHNPRHRAMAVSLLIALGVGQQFFNANIFRRDWENQTEIYWQLAWRIPALEPNTVLLTHQMPIDYETDLSFTAPINWMYAPDFTPPHLPYALLYTEKRLGGSTLPSFEPGTPIHLYAHPFSLSHRGFQRQHITGNCDIQTRERMPACARSVPQRCGYLRQSSTRINRCDPAFISFAHHYKSRNAGIAVFSVHRIGTCLVLLFHQGRTGLPDEGLCKNHFIATGGRVPWVQTPGSERVAHIHRSWHPHGKYRRD
jgi:hypothetical protein